MDTRSSVPYINEFRFLFLAGTPLRFNSSPLADDFVGEPKNEVERICHSNNQNKKFFKDFIWFKKLDQNI